MLTGLVFQHSVQHMAEGGISSEGKKYTPKLFSALKIQVSQQAKNRFGVYQKAGFNGEKRGKYIYTKEASRCLWGTRLRRFSLTLAFFFFRFFLGITAFRRRRFSQKTAGNSRISRSIGV